MTIGEAMDALWVDGTVCWRHGWVTREDPIYLRLASNLETVYPDGFSVCSIVLSREDFYAGDWATGSEPGRRKMFEAVDERTSYQGGV